MGLRSRWVGPALVALVCFLGDVSARADEPLQISPKEDADLKAQYSQLFAEMLKRPADLDLMFKFASVAARLGNNEAAISTLERMLLFNRNLPRVKLELGVLYFKLGSYGVARSYFEDAISGKDIPDTVKQRAQTYIAEIDKRTSRNHFAGSLTFGLRYQTNANAGPSSSNVLVQGNNAVLNDTFLNQPDWNAFVSGYLTHSYDLQWGDGETWDTTVQGYYARQFSLDELNLGFFETTTGPRFFLSQRQGAEFSLRTFALGNVVTLGDLSDFGTLGAGLELDKTLASGRLMLNGGYTYRHKFFQDTGERPTNDQFTSNQHTFALGGTYFLTSTIQLGLNGYVNDETANADFQSNHEYSVAADIGKQYPAPFGLTRFPWAVDLSARGTWTDYQAPDPSVDPNTARSDDELRLTLSNTAGITQDLSLLLQVQYADHQSNLPNFVFTNTSVLFGGTWSF